MKLAAQYKASIVCSPNACKVLHLYHALPICVAQPQVSRLILTVQHSEAFFSHYLYIVSCPLVMKIFPVYVCIIFACYQVLTSAPRAFLGPHADISDKQIIPNNQKILKIIDKKHKKIQNITLSYWQKHKYKGKA